MKRMKKGIAALVIALLAVTVAVVGAQPPGNNGGGGMGNGGPRQGRGGIQMQVIADTLGIDVQTLQTDLQNGQTIADVASAQKVELSAIIDAVVAKQTEQLTQMVTDGQLTQAQMDAQLTLLKANLNVELTKVMNAQANPPQADGTAQPNPGQRGTDQLTIIAQTLGIDVATLQSDLQNGQTIADIATAQNVELSAITDAVVAARTTGLNQAVTDGTLTQEQADAQILVLKANLEARYSQQWNANMPMGQMDLNGNGGPMGQGPNGNGGPGGNFPPNGQGGQPPQGGPDGNSPANGGQTGTGSST